MTSLPEPQAIKLGLVIDLDICVGCHACVVNCKEWNTSGYSTFWQMKMPMAMLIRLMA